MKNDLTDTDIGEPQDIITRADELLNQKRYKETLAVLDRIPVGSDEYPSSLLMRSMIVGIMGDDEKSFEIYNEFLRVRFGDFNGDFTDKNLDLTTPEELFQCGLFHFHIFKDYRKAIRYFDLSLKLNPKQSDVVCFKAISFAFLGKFKNAVKMMDEAIKLSPDNSEYWNYKGLFLTQLNYTNKAHLAFDKSIKIEATGDAWANKGVLYCKYDKFDEALYCFDKAIGIDSSDIYSIVCKASIYSELRDFETADRYFKEAEKINPKDVMYLSELGRHYLNQCKFEKSLEYLDESLRLDEQLAFSWMYKSIALSELGRDRESEICFKKALDLDPDSILVFDEIMIIEE